MATETMPQIISRKEAMALGLRRYFTGKPCRRGHITERGVASRSCVACDRLWAAAHPEVARNAGRRYNAAHREERRSECRARYAMTDPKERCARVRAWTLANPDKVRKNSRASYAANPEAGKASSKAWRIAHPESTRKYGRDKKARKLAAEGTHTVADIQRIYAAQRGKCAYCRIFLRGGYHVDHIIALINGGSNWPANLQLTCRSCNSSKQAADPIEFAQRKGMLI